MLMDVDRSRFPNGNTIDVLDWIILCWGAILCIVGCLAPSLGFIAVHHHQL